MSVKKSPKVAEGSLVTLTGHNGVFIVKTLFINSIIVTTLSKKADCRIVNNERVKPIINKNGKVVSKFKLRIN